MSTLCPDGHQSDEPDYCSVCGAPMGGTAAAGAAAGPAGPAGSAGPAGPAASAGSGPSGGAGAAPGAASTAGPVCPSCGAPRTDPDARFCEVCRYDFESGTPGPPPVAPDPISPPAAQAPPDPAAPAAPTAPAGPANWDVTVVVDTTLDTEPDPDTPAPTGAGERIFPVDLPEMLIGRRDDAHDIRPEVPIQDPAVSRRHAKLLRLPTGGLAILDLASANGTAVNGTETPAGERHELADGDQITLGRWTRITVHRRP